MNNLFFNDIKMSQPVLLLLAIILVIIVIYWINKSKNQTNQQVMNMFAAKTQPAQIKADEAMGVKAKLEVDKKLSKQQEPFSDDSALSGASAASFSAAYSYSAQSAPESYSRSANEGYAGNFPRFVARKSNKSFYDIPNPKYY
jgi:hypothetical protein